MERERIIVLRKTRYSENSLIIAAFGADCGRIDFLVKGALKKHPCIDLFRELDIACDPARSGGLQTVYDIELLEEFDAVADSTFGFLMAGDMANFLLKNLHHAPGCPLVFRTFRNILAVLAKKDYAPKWDADFCMIAFKTAFLKEHGMLPDDRIFNKIVKILDLPETPDFDFREAAAEIDEICLYNY